MVDRGVEIVPSGAREPRADFIIKPDLAMAAQRALHRQPQDVIAFFVGDFAADGDPDDVVRQLVDHFNHFTNPVRC